MISLTKNTKLTVFSYSDGEDILFKISLFNKATRQLTANNVNKGIMTESGEIGRVLCINHDALVKTNMSIP